MTRRPVTVDLTDVRLPGDLGMPDHPEAIVVFAHGSGSSRTSPRNVAVADRLERDGLATMLFDLLTPAEAGDRDRVFDIPLLASRLVETTGWVRAQPGIGALPVAFFGASTGAAAALVASAGVGEELVAVVSRGGRPDLAREALDRVDAPTLLIVGGDDPVVLDLNRQALGRLRGEGRLEVVPGAGHLFEEPGALERVADLAAGWISLHLV